MEADSFTLVRQLGPHYMTRLRETEETVYGECSDVYTEGSAGLSFRCFESAACTLQIGIQQAELFPLWDEQILLWL